MVRCWETLLVIKSFFMYQMFQNPILEPSLVVNDLNVLYVVDVGKLR